MAGSTNFKVFNPNLTNMMDDNTYNTSGYRLNGAVSGLAPSNIHNKLYYQVTTMTAAFAQALANKGFTVSDDNFNNLVTVLSNIALQTDNVASATKLQIMRKINGVNFDGSADITITAAANGGNADTVDGKHASDFLAAGFCRQKLNVDINTLKTFDFFYCINCTNTPGGDGYLTVLPLDNKTVCHDYTLYTGIKYNRVCNSDTWSPWRQTVTTDYPAWGNDTNGGRKLPDGRIEQWGEFDYTGLARDTSKTIAFPVKFVSAVSTVLLTRNTITLLPLNGVENFSALNYTLDGFDFQFESTGSAGNAGAGSTMKYRVWGR